MKRINFLLLSASVAILIALMSTGCRKCECLDDIYDTAFFIRFDTASGQFSSAEIGSNAYILRFAKGDTVNAVDTVAQASGEFAFILGEIESDFESFDYLIDGNGTYDYKYRITDIQLNGDYNEGKCKCYLNTLKTCKINGVTIDRTNSNEYILLQK
ncbi:MAG: hypothetical protein K1X92_02890 [Bacteroidia bacterium]|nr:hypothetical protein [Bacteroidia bacterium]